MTACSLARTSAHPPSLIDEALAAVIVPSLANAGAAQAPEWFTTAPAKAIDNALAKLKLDSKQIGLHEINEAFSVVTMAVAKLCNIDLAKVNVRGGAVALGHPIGASGARILTTLLYAMKDHDVERGMASICIGGGEALALVAHRG